MRSGHRDDVLARIQRKVDSKGHAVTALTTFVLLLGLASSRRSGLS